MAQNRLSGINPEAYMGVEASSPPQFVYYKRDPTAKDYSNFNIGTIWLNSLNETVWILVNMDFHVATWVQLLAGTGGAINFQTADGLTAVPNVAGRLFVPGGTLITTATAPNVNSIEISVTNGGDGQVIIGQGANPPVWGDLTSAGGTIDITPDLTGPGTINLDVVGAPGATTYVEDAGDATPAANILNIVGDGVNISTTGAGNTVTIDLINPGVATTYTTDAGNATPAANILNVVGDGANITTSGAGNTVTVSLAAPIVPFRSAFSYRQTGASGNVTGDGTIVTLQFPTLIFDLNHDFDGVSTFTAPRTGVYCFRGQVYLSCHAQPSYLQTYIVTSVNTFVSNVINIANLTVGGSYSATHDVIASLNVGAQVQFKFSVAGGTKNVTYGPGQNGFDSTFSGFLIS